MLKFAIIGCGNRARIHEQNIKGFGVLSAACDINKEKADAFAKETNAKSYDDFDSMMQAEKDIDIVCICTPTGIHAEHVIKSLQSGCDVICETPLCITSAAAWQMIETSKFSRQKLFVVNSVRHQPIIKDLKKLIDEKSLGRIYSFHLNCFRHKQASAFEGWQGKEFPAGGTLYTEFNNYIDVVTHLFGSIKEAIGFRSKQNNTTHLQFEDTGMASVEMSTGVSGSINWSVNTPVNYNEASLLIIAENATIKLGGPFMNEIQFQQSEKPFIFSDNSGHGNESVFRAQENEQMESVYAELMKAFTAEAVSLNNVLEETKTIEAIEKIYKNIPLSIPAE